MLSKGFEHAMGQCEQSFLFEYVCVRGRKLEIQIIEGLFFSSVDA